MPFLPRVGNDLQAASENPFLCCVLRTIPIICYAFIFRIFLTDKSKSGRRQMSEPEIKEGIVGGVKQAGSADNKSCQLQGN